ncbi:MAG TPA: HTTM domain-containing protein [Thermomicrobiales bacterium]|nr:HTTM domain-containing protein [Thermomicrobiales bacterium]
MQPLEATAMIRRLVGLALAIQALDTTLALRRILAPDVLRTPFFDGMPLMPSSLLLPFAFAWVAAAAALALGYRTRLASVVLVTVVGYALLLDQQSYANHIYLQILIVLILLLPADLAVRALRWQMTVVYLFGAISKINVVFISGALLAANLRHGWLLPFPDSLARPAVLMPVAAGAILADAFLAYGFWKPRYRAAAAVFGLLFHTAIILTFPASSLIGLVVFALTMWALYYAFLDPVEVWKRAATRLAVSIRQRLGRGTPPPATALDSGQYP